MTLPTVTQLDPVLHGCDPGCITCARCAHCHQGRDVCPEPACCCLAELSDTDCLDCDGTGRIEAVRLGREVEITCPDCEGSTLNPDARRASA